MGMVSGDVKGPLSDPQQAQIKEALLKTLAERDGVLYERPLDEKLPEGSVRRPGVETGG